MLNIGAHAFCVERLMRHRGYAVHR
jgi:hypothetical protein